MHGMIYGVNTDGCGLILWTSTNASAIVYAHTHTLYNVTKSSFVSRQESLGTRLDKSRD